MHKQLYNVVNSDLPGGTRPCAVDYTKLLFKLAGCSAIMGQLKLFLFSTYCSIRWSYMANKLIASCKEDVSDKCFHLSGASRTTSGVAHRRILSP